MGKFEKIIVTILSGRSDENVAFSDLCSVLERLGFRRRIKGDHHIFVKEGVAEILNLQPRKTKAKPYQVRQVRAVLVRYKLGANE